MPELVRRPLGTTVVALSVIALLAAGACGGSAATQTPTNGGPAAPTSAAASPEASSAEETGAQETGAQETAAEETETPTGSAVPQGGGNVPDPAALVSADMAASVIGGSPQQVQIPGLGNVPAKVVAYSTDSGDTLTVFIEQVPGAFQASALQAAIAMAGVQGNVVPVSGVGDAAGKVVEENNAVIAFVKGDVMVVIGAQSGASSGAQLDPKVEGLAKQVSDKL